MDTPTPLSSTAETTESPRRVSNDLRAAGTVLAVVIVGNALWHASDSGIISAFAGR